MKNTTINVTIDDIHYALKPSDIGAIHNMPAAHREQLLALLEPVKRIHQHDMAKASTGQKTTTANRTKASVSKAQAPQPSSTSNQPALSREEAANRVAKLMLAEKAKQKPPLNKKILYFWILAISAVLFLMMAML